MVIKTVQRHKHIMLYEKYALKTAIHGALELRFYHMTQRKEFKGRWVLVTPTPESNRHSNKKEILSDYLVNSALERLGDPVDTVFGSLEGSKYSIRSIHQAVQITPPKAGVIGSIKAGCRTLERLTNKMIKAIL